MRYLFLKLQHVWDWLDRFCLLRLDQKLELFHDLAPSRAEIYNFNALLRLQSNHNDPNHGQIIPPLNIFDSIFEITLTWQSDIIFLAKKIFATLAVRKKIITLLFCANPPILSFTINFQPYLDIIKTGHSVQGDKEGGGGKKGFCSFFRATLSSWKKLALGKVK